MWLRFVIVSQDDHADSGQVRGCALADKTASTKAHLPHPDIETRSAHPSIDDRYKQYVCFNKSLSSISSLEEKKTLKLHAIAVARARNCIVTWMQISPILLQSL